jgi:hypothetical protein
MVVSTKQKLNEPLYIKPVRFNRWDENKPDRFK